MFRELTRKKQALSKEECVEILRKEPRGVLSVSGDDGYPYGMPMNFLYDENENKIYFHSGKSGHRIDAVRKNPKVSFCVYDKGYRKEGEWALNIKSVIVFGKISLIEDGERVRRISRELSLKYTSDTAYIEHEIKAFSAAAVCLSLEPEYMTGKLVNES